jgi:uncharacterized protein (DUF1330 family)
MPFLALSRSATLAVALFLTSSFVAMTEPAAAQDDPAPVTVELRKGEVLQVIAPEAREGGLEARRSYYRDVILIAENYGFRRLGQLDVEQKVVGEFDPGAFIFFSWPSAVNAQAFLDRPDLPEIRARRPDGWHELKIFDDLVEENTTLILDPNKDYSIVVAWFDPANPGDYRRYLEGIEPAVEREGGRFIYKMRNPTLETNANSEAAPGQITFVEWADREGFVRVQKTPEYLAHRSYFASGTTRFEFYWLGVTGRNR